MQINKKEKISKFSKNIVLIVSDIDGVLTDGRIYFDSAGKEMKVFHVRDSFRIEIWKKNGRQMLWFTGRKAEGAIARARELGVDLVFKQDLQSDLLEYIKKQYGLDDGQILYIGDDWNDLYYMSKAGIAVAPKDGREENKKLADMITDAKGGESVLSETIEFLMKEQGSWDEASDEYLKKFIL